MPVRIRFDVLTIANAVRLTVNHFAYGTWEHAKGELEVPPVNRFFLPVCIPSPGNYVEDSYRRLPFRAGKAYFIPCGHPIRMYLQDDLVFYSVQFSLQVRGGIDFFSKSDFMLELDEDWTTQVKQAYDRNDKYASMMLLRCIVSNLAAQILDKEGAKAIDSVLRFARFQNEIDYISAHLSATLRVGEIAKANSRSREQFTRAFSRTTGMTPKEFLNTMLLRESCNRLAVPGRYVKEIATDLGFSSEYYFSKFIKRNIGLTPSQYRFRLGVR